MEWRVPASYVTEFPTDIFLVLDPSQFFTFLVGAVNTGLFEMIVGVLTTCHTQYTSDRSTRIFLI
jgi:hypothetical protein